MQVILTKSVRKLGKVGDTVNVANGFGRNYLLPQELAIRATSENIEKFSSLQKDLEKENKNNIALAKKTIETLKGKNLIFAVQSSADGRLFGSIGTKTIAKELDKVVNLNLKYHNILINEIIKFNGVYDATVVLHPEVTTQISIVVAKTEEEAQIALKDHHEAKNKPAKDSSDEKTVSDSKEITEEIAE